MDFALTREQRQLLETARNLALAEMRDMARQLEETNEPLSRQYLMRYADLGFLGTDLEPGYGGLDLTGLDALIVLEEFARVHPAVALPISEGCPGPIKVIECFASEPLKSRLIPAVCKEELTVAAAMSEAGAGSALTDLRARAEPRGGELVLNGGKRRCSGGGHAGGYLVYCGLSAKGGQITASEATMNLWAAAPEADLVVARLLERGIVGAPGPLLGPSGEGYVRFALVPPLGQCHRAAEILEQL
jgi:alkylation response protein AidB-like acyl-CoA dehydrogenase